MTTKQLLCIAVSLGCLPLAAIEGPEEAQPANPKAIEGLNEGPAKKVEQPGYLGVFTIDIPELLQAQMPELEGGAVVRGVIEGSAAKEAEIQVHDIITKVDDKAIASREALHQVISGLSAGTKVQLEVLRAGEPVELNAELSERPVQSRIAQIPGNWGRGPAGAMDLEKQLFDRLENMIPGSNLGQLRRQLNNRGDFMIPPQLVPEIRRLENEIQRLRNDGAALQGLQLPFNGNGIESHVFRSKSFSDPQGKVELKNDGESTNLFLYDNAGNLLYEGPFNEDADLNAIPDDQLDRLEQFNIKPGADLNQDQFPLDVNPGR